MLEIIEKDLIYHKILVNNIINISIFNIFTFTFAIFIVSHLF